MEKFHFDLDLLEFTAERRKRLDDIADAFLLYKEERNRVRHAKDAAAESWSGPAQQSYLEFAQKRSDAQAEKVWKAIVGLVKDILSQE